MQGISTSSASDLTGIGTTSNGSLNDAIDALTVLGYSRSEAMEALRGVDTKLPTEDLIRAALKKLMRG